MKKNSPFSELRVHRTRANILTGCIVALVYVLLQHFADIRRFLGGFFELISPFVSGLVLAYLLNLILSGLERLFLHRIGNKKLMRTLSLILTVVLAVLLIAGLLFAIIPQLIKSISTLVAEVQAYLISSEPEIREFASHFEIGESIVNLVYGSWSNALSTISNWVKDIAPDLLNTTVRFGSGLVRGFISLFIAIYVLADKERLLRHARLVLRAFASGAVYNRVNHAAKRVNHLFSSFIAGKLLDSLIIGILCFIGMMIFRMPNALLISVIVGVTNVIPTFGPFIGAIPSIFIILIDSPVKALYFAIFILVLQQVDGNLIGPLILGDTTGLSALWVLVAICFFGSLWGVVGMLVGVPIVAICYEFFAEYVAARLARKGYGLDNEPIPPAADTQQSGQPGA